MEQYYWLAFLLSGVFMGAFLGVVWLIQKRQERTALLESAPAPEKPTTTRTADASAPIILQRTAEAVPAPPVSDPRTATRTALARLPRISLVPDAPAGIIPLLYDHERWQALRLGVDGHWGIFGATGSGKGNALQHIALAALRCGPALCQLVVLDPKGGLDYGFCLDIEHATLYKGAALTEGYKAVVAEMDRRHEVLLAAEARHHHEYYQKTGERLPVVLVIADEVAELSKEQKELLGTIARMGRAAGIVLCVATQYPTVEALSNQVQANIKNRLVFRLESSTYTAVALRRTREDGGTYEPAAIDVVGVAVLRREGGHEVLGRVPEVDDETRSNQITVLKLQWATTPAVSEEPDVRRLFEQIEEPVRTSMSVPVDRISEGEPDAAEPVRASSENAVLADTNEIKPVRTDLPQDTDSQMIRALVHAGFSRNKIADRFSEGGRAAALKRIKRAIGEVEDATN